LGVNFDTGHSSMKLDPMGLWRLRKHAECQSLANRRSRRRKPLQCSHLQIALFA
jgi:hypothetical protein